MIDLTDIFKALAYLLIACASAFLIPWLKSRTTEAQREELLKWVDIAVSAAQQLYHDSNGQDRLDYALSVLSDRGFNIDTVEVRNAIEASVLKLHQQLGDTNDG